MDVDEFIEIGKRLAKMSNNFDAGLVVAIKIEKQEDGSEKATEVYVVAQHEAADYLGPVMQEFQRAWLAFMEDDDPNPSFSFQYIK